MKKILAGVLTAATLLCAAVIPASAAGTLLHSDDFTDGYAAKNWELYDQEFKWHEDGYIFGYSAARVVQSNYNSRNPKIYDKFYTCFDVKVCDFDDMLPVEGNHIIGFWYRDLFENADDSKGAVYQYFVEVETGYAYIIKSHEFSYYDEHDILRHHTLDGVKICEGNIGGPIPMGDDAPYVNLGLRVTEGRIEGYYNQQLVCFAEVDPEGEKLGDTYLAGVDPTVGSQKSPILFWSGLDDGGKLYIHLDNFEVWTPDYDFVEEVPVNYGDANSDGKVNINDATAMLKKLAKWDVEIDETAANVNGDDKFNISDVTHLLKYLAKWDVILGPAE